METGRDRQQASDKNNDRLELSGDEFLEAVRSGYHELVNSDDRAHLIDANGTIDEVHNRVKNLLRREMPATFALLGD